MYPGLENLRNLTVRFTPLRTSFPFSKMMTLFTNLKRSNAFLSSLTISKSANSGAYTQLSHPFIEHIVNTYGDSLTELLFCGLITQEESLPLICERCTELETLTVPFPPNQDVSIRFASRWRSALTVFQSQSRLVYAIEKARSLHTLIHNDAHRTGHTWDRSRNALQHYVDYLFDVARDLRIMEVDGVRFEVCIPS